MRYAYIIIGAIVLLILLGVAFAFMRNGNSQVAGYPYQASMANTAYGNRVANVNTNCVNPCQAVQQTYSYPVVYPTYTNTTACPYNTTATAASMWYTSPAYTSIVPGYYSSSYVIPGTTNTTVYPGGVNQVYPGSSQVYQYQVPGYNGGSYGYPTQTQYPQYQQYPQGNVQVSATAGGGTWYR